MKKEMEKKAFWGVYFNIAYHDLVRTLQAHLPNKNPEDAKKFLACFENKKTKAHFDEQLRKKNRFPFFESLANSFSDKKTYEKMHAFLETIENLRNHYSHLFTVPPTIIKEATENDKKFIHALKMIYDGAVNTVKERFKLDEKEVEKYRRTRPGKPKKGESNLKNNKEFHWKLDDENGNLNKIGQAFLGCLCMKKRFRGQFFEGMKEKNKKIYTETFRRICDALAIKPPNPKIQNEQTDFQFGMDILGTLRKCPYELFKFLEKEEQEKFRIKDEQGNEILLKRNDKNHKFESLALEYLERLKVFQQVGIFSYIGNYYSKCYDKNVIDGEKEKRYIHKRAYATGHFLGEKGLLKHLENYEKNKDITQKIKEEEPEPFEKYLSKVTPKYILNQNKIGFSKMNLEDTQGKKFLLPKIEFEKLKNQIPQVWLSKNELPALVFYAYLLEQNKKELQTIPEILFEHRFENIFENKKEKTENTIAKIKNRLEEYIKESDYKLGKITNFKYIPFGKKQHRKPIKDGQMASWLASDLMQLQPSKQNGKDKITAPNYQALQRSLAISDWENWKRVFHGAKLLHGNIAHPFLKEILKSENQKDNIKEFYLRYLQKRKNYFEKWLEKIKLKMAMGKNFNPQDAVFQKLFRKYNKQKTTANEKFLAKFLPRGIFTKSIKNYFEKYGCEKMQKIVKQEKVNAAFMIQKYFEIVEQDNLPEMYRKKRNYKFLENKKPDYPSDEEWKNDEKFKDKIKKWKNYKEKTKNEDKIRLWGTQDRLLFLMSKKVMPEDMVENPDYKLEKIKTIFETKTKFSFKQNFEQEYHKGEVTFEFENVPLKNYGRIYNYKTDSRMENLAAIIHKEDRNNILNNIFQEKDLEQEFKNYEKERLDVLKFAFEIEKTFFEKFPEEKEKIKKGEKKYFNFEDILEKMGIEENRKLLAGIRNKFAHTDYLERQHMKNKEIGLPKIAEEMKKAFEKNKPS